MAFPADGKPARTGKSEKSCRSSDSSRRTSSGAGSGRGTRVRARASQPRTRAAPERENTAPEAEAGARRTIIKLAQPECPATIRKRKGKRRASLRPAAATVALRLAAAAALAVLIGLGAARAATAAAAAPAQVTAHTSGTGTGTGTPDASPAPSGPETSALRAPGASVANRSARAAFAEHAPSPSRLQAINGQRVELLCPLAAGLAPSAAAAGRHSLLWSLDGRPLDGLDPRRRLGPGNASLSIASAQARLDELPIECSLLEPGGAPDGNRKQPPRTHRFELRLVTRPKLAPFECPGDAQVGQRLVLTCSVLEGHQPLSFVWLKDGQVIGHEEPPDERRPATLGALHRQQLAERLLSGAQTGATGRFQPASGGQAEPAAQQEQPLSWLADARIRVRQAEDYSILSIDGLELRHAGLYTCSVENEAARAAHSSQLSINAPPTLTVEPQDRELVAGQSVLLDCAARGQPRPAVAWHRGRAGKEEQWDYVPVYDSLKYSVFANGSLAVANVSQREQGFYLCSARNGFAPEASKLVRLNVHEPASFAAKFQTVEVRAEERAELSCAATGERPIRIEWLDKELNQISQRNDKRYLIEETDTGDGGAGGEQPSGAPPTQTARPKEGGASSRLILTRSGRADSGHYTCQASNKYGSDKMITNLLVLDVPDQVEELKVTNVTSTSVSLRWQPGFSGNAPVTSYLVQYQSDDPLDDLLNEAAAAVGQRPSPGRADAPPAQPGQTEAGPAPAASSTSSLLKGALEALAAGEAGSADEAIDRTLVELSVEQAAGSLVVRDLQAYCVYRIRLAPVNRLGLGRFSPWLRAKTEEAAPAGSAARLVAVATGPNSLKVSWWPPERRTWNGQLLGFQLGYRPLDSQFESNRSIEWTPPVLPAHLLDQVAKQQGEPPPPPPHNSSARADGQRHLLRQQLRQLLALQQQELVAHLTNLQRSTTYLVWVQARNERGLGPQSHAISVRTLEDVPPSAPALRVQGATASSLTLTWSLLGGFQASANHYSLYYRRVPAAAAAQQPPRTAPWLLAVDNAGSGPQPAYPEPAQPAGQRQAHFLERLIAAPEPLEGRAAGSKLAAHLFAPHGSPAQFLYQLDQLECGATYELYMTTRNSVGKSEPSSLVTGRTLGSVPVAPAARHAFFARIGATEAALSLAAWSSGGCPLTHLSIRYRALGAAASAGEGAHSAAPPPSQSRAAAAPSAWLFTSSIPSGLLNALNGLHQQHQLQQLQQLQLQSSAGVAQPTSGGYASAEPAPVYLLKQLAPATGYELEMVAGNSAGDSSASLEFVTGASNGSRAGFVRGLEPARPAPGELPGVELAEHALAGYNQQQQQQQQQHLLQQAGGQLLPLLLVALLCLVCLLVSASLCYGRLVRFRKRGSPCSSSPSLSGGGGGARKAPWQQQQHAHLAQAASGSCESVGLRWPAAAAAAAASGSGATRHYCVPSGEPQLLSAILNPKNPASSFSQSVSMKDFNLLAQGSSQQQHQQQHQQPALEQALQHQSTTLNAKSLRQQVAAAHLVKSGTLRAQLMGGGACSLEPGLHPQYAAGCQSLAAPAAPAAPAAGARQSLMSEQVCAGFGAGELQPHHLCAGQASAQPPDEYLELASEQARAKQSHMANYAVPAIYSAVSSGPNHYALEPGDEAEPAGEQGAHYADHTGIDVCIQQLMEQQYQQQQQQQQQQHYAMIVNQKLELARCAGLAHAQTDGRQSGSAACGAPGSLIDSSSSSSGIDVNLTHLDCGASSTTGTSQHSAGSNPAAVQRRETNFCASVQPAQPQAAPAAGGFELACEQL